MHSNSRKTKYMSFTGTNDYDGPPKVGFEALASPGQVITVSTAEGFNSSCKPYSGSILETNTGCNKQVGTGYTVTTYTPKQFDAHSIGRAHYKRISPVSNITSHNISVTTGNLFSHRSDLNHQSLGEVATINSALLAPANTAFVGTTDLRSDSKASGGPAQLTIFYAGSVCVYDDVSPEKAQAIMLLAGNGSSLTNPVNKTPSPPTPTNPLSKTPSPPTPTTTIATRIETRTQRPLCGPTGLVSNKLSSSHATPVCLSAIPSPMPISVCIPRHASCGVSNGFAGHELRKTTSSCMNFPSPISVSTICSGGSIDVTPARSLASLASPTSKPEPSKVAIIQNARVSTNATNTTPSAVPQARKASLARFLEKRKERAETVAPYSYTGKQRQECATPGSESRSFSPTSVGSFSFSSIK